MLKSYWWDGWMELGWKSLLWAPVLLIIKQNIRPEKVFGMTMGERSFQNNQKFLQLSEERKFFFLSLSPKPIHKVYNLTQSSCQGPFLNGACEKKATPHTHTFSGQIPTDPNIVKIWHAEILCKPASYNTILCNWNTRHDCFNFFNNSPIKHT